MGLVVFFLRHGQTTFSRDNMFCGSGLDPELTGDGAQMSEAFASAYRALSWTAIYTSPLKRTLATARIIGERVAITPRPHDGLKEIGYGEWEGKSVEEVRRDFHDDYLRWSSDPAWNAPTGGESAILIARRALEVVEEIKRAHSEGNILVVSHKATIRTVLCALLGIDVGRFRYRLGCPVGSVSTVEFKDQGPLLHTLADTRHLSDRLRDLPGT